MTNFSKKTLNKTVEDLMQKEFLYVSKTSSFNELVSILSNCSLNAPISKSVLPLVESHEKKIFLGVVPCSELLKFLHKKDKKFEKLTIKILKSEMEKIKKSGEQFSEKNYINNIKNAFYEYERKFVKKEEAYGTYLKVESPRNSSMKLNFNNENVIDPYSVKQYSSYRDVFPLPKNEEDEHDNPFFSNSSPRKRKKNRAKLKDYSSDNTTLFLPSKRKSNSELGETLKEDRKESDQIIKIVPPKEENQSCKISSFNIYGFKFFFFTVERRFSQVFVEKIEKLNDSMREQEIYKEAIEGLKTFLQQRRNVVFEEELGEIFSSIHFNESPFQVVSKTPLSKLHFLFSILIPKVSYITDKGVLVGIITKDILVKFLG